MIISLSSCFAPVYLQTFLLANCREIYLQMRRILICTAQPENIPYKQTPWNEILALFVNLATNQSCLIGNQLAYLLCPLWGISIISKAIEPFISYCICKKLVLRKKYKIMHNESNWGSACLVETGVSKSTENS